MKTAQRLVAMILVLVLLTANGGIVALAEAVLTMPAALQIIDEEAFYGSTSIDRVVLPNKVTEIRSKAFANSTLSEINLPASITYIADDAFDGPNKVTVSAAEGTYAYRWAVEHGYISEEIEAIDFTVSPDMLTLTVGSTYTLNASFVPSNATTVSVTWGSSKKTVATVNNGTITAKAEGTAIITAIAENGLTATCEVTVVRSIPTPTITSADQDGMGTIVLTWNSLGNGYEYLVYESVDDALVLLGSTINNAYTTHAASAGVHKYCVQACILNDNDILVSSDESAAYDVDVQFIWSFGASIEKIEQTSQNSASITWRGVSPVSYYEIAEVVGNNYTVIANNLTGDTTTISALNQGVHRYAIRSIYNDHDNKTWISSWSTLKAVETVDFAALQPGAPELLFSDQSSAFSRTESGAPEFEAQRFELSWEQVENAIEYGIRLSYKQGSNWIDIIDDTTKENSFSLNESFFEGLTELTSYRVMLTSTGITESSPNVYYFCVYPLQVNTSLLINGVASTAIYHTSATGKTYNFDIESQYNVTATNSADWLIVECDKNTLSITIDDDNSISVRERNSIVTLSNGYSEATIDVYQWNIDDAPILDNYDFSTVAEEPTDIPYGDISLIIRKRYGKSSDGCVIIAELYQQSSNGEWSLISQIVKEKLSTTLDISYENSGIEIGKTLKLKVVECGLAEYNSGTLIYKPNLTNEYYFRMMSSGHAITVNGQSSIAISSAEAVTVSVVANSTWSYSTQCDWITLKTQESNIPNCGNLTIKPTKNDTENARTATITLNCGSATSTITFTQLSTKPVVVLPVLSTKESSPTTLTAGDEDNTFAEFVFRNLASATFEYKSGSTYVEDSDLEIYRSPSIRSYTYYEAYDWSQFTTGVVYRLTVSNGETDTVYYFKVNSGSTYALIKPEGVTSFRDTYYYNASSTGTILTFTLKSSASWTATTDASWLHLSKTSGSKNTSGISITLTIDPNDTNAIRYGIASFKISQTDRCFIRIEQNPVGEYLTLYQCTYNGTITNSELDFSSVEGCTGEFYLLARTNAVRLSYSSDVSWMKATNGDYDNIKVSITAANTDSVSRTGHLTITAGTVSETVTVTQVPDIGKVTLVSPELVNTTKTEPGVVQYGDLNVTWNKTDHAVRYYVRLNTPGDEDLYYEVEDNGSSSYSLNIPIKEIGSLQDGVYSLRIYSYDAWNYYNTNVQYFRFVQGDSIFIGGEIAPVWNNVTEYSITSDPYTVMSTGNWMAQSNSSWITLSRTTGDSGDFFTVTLAQNTGNARSGRITVSCGNATGYLTVNQCAPIPEFPSLTLPNYSTDKNNPTIIPADTTSITATWINEPQASQYEIDLLEYSDKSAGHYVAESGSLRNGEEQYTFQNLSLTKGQLYWITIKRTNNRKTTGTSYYFMLGDENSFVTLDGETSITYEHNARGRGLCYSVNSSGVWTAISDSNWLTVGKKYIDEDYLAGNGREAEDYLEHYGQSGDALYVYMFPNTTTSSRTGTVTVKSGTASATITFTQEKQYTVASLIEPAALAANPNEDIEISYGSLHLNWSASSSGTGNYEVLLYESDTGRGGYSRIYRKQGITSRSLTIPQSTFTEGKYYKLWLGSEIEDGDDYENGNYYYFTMGYQNGLAVSAIVDWSQVDHGGYVSINAFASGGAGGYEYAYQMLRNGEYEQQAEWGSLTYYQFKPWSNGNYQIRVLAKDSTGKQVSYTSNYTKNDENTISVATANHYTASLDSSYQFLDYSVLSQRSWSVTNYPNWITPSVTSTSFSGDIRLIVAKNDGVTRIGKVEFQSNTGIISDLTITQSGSRSVAMVATEETFTNEAQTIDVSFTASDRWTASSDSSWAIVNTKSGTSGNRTITVSLSENTVTTERTATVSVISNGDIGQYTIHQLGKAVEQSGLKLSTTSWLVSSTAAESKTITITTNGNWSISSIPTWMSSDVSTGSGNSDVSLYCSSNTEQSARSGVVTITSGNLTQSINISQPGNDVIATVVGFTLSNTTVDTGTKVNFTVITKNADQVQLLVDDIAYNKYDVVDNQVTFTRAFSQGGTRKITILPIRMGESGLVSDAKYLTVNSNGALDKPSFSITPDNDYVGVAATITIPKVNNADTYTIRVYAPNSSLIVDALQVSESELASNNRKITVDAGTLLFEGVYSVNIIASGQGYSQSEDGNTFTRNARNYSISFSAPNDGAEYVPGDTIYATINQTGGGYASIKAVSPSGDEIWYPTSENTTAETSFTAYIPVEESGTYSIYGYVFALDLPASQNIVQKESQITVKAKGPEISRINVAEYGKIYTWIYQAAETNLYVTTNSAVERVTIKDSLSENAVSTASYSLDGWNRLFTVKIPNNSAGSHSILITAIDEDTNRSTTATVDFYIAVPVNNYTAYASADVSIVSSPISGRKVADVLGGAYFEPVTVTHNAGDWLKISDYLGNSGFVKSTSISQSVPANASGNITIVSPTANETIPKGTSNTISIRWKSGIALNSQPNLTAILINSNTGTTYTLNSSTLFNSQFSVSSVPDGQYSVYLQLKNAAGTTVKSNTVSFVLGGYSDEAYYKEWFKNEIYPWYSNYLESMGLYMDSRAMDAIQEANRFVVGGFVSDGNHWWKVLNNEELSSWITMSETERRQMNLTLVSNLVLEDKEKANNKLKPDMSNISNVVATQQNNKIVVAKWNTIFSAVEAGWSATQTAMKTAAFTQTVSTGISTEVSTAFSDTVETWGERIIEMLKDLMMDTIEDYNSEALIEAYKEEYARAMKKACQEYIDYLEITLFGGIGGSNNVNANTLDGRQQAALTYIKAYRQYMNNPSRMKEDALVTLLSYCDSSITMDQITRDGYTLDEAIKAKFSDPDTYGMLLERMIDYLLDDAVKLVYERIKPNLAIKEFTAIVRVWLTKIFKWDKVNHKFAPDMAGLKSQLEADALKYGFSLSFGTFLDILGQVNVNNMNYWEDMETYIDNGLDIPDSVIEDHRRVKNGIVKSALDVCKSAWKTGNKIAGLIGDAVEWNSQSSGRAMFEMYGAYMAGAFKYRLTYTSGAMVLNFNWDYLSTLSIKELEQKRAGLITLMNNDVDALTYYRNMRTVNENANWKFHLVLRDANGNETDRYDQSDYASYALIDAQIDWINAVKKWMVKVPSDIQVIINKYN